MQRGRSILWLGLFFALVFIVGVTWFLARSRRSIGEKVVLNDGTELRLHAITYGKEHNVALGKPWDYVLDQVPETGLPRWKWLPDWHARLQKNHLTFSEDGLVLWFALLSPTSAPPIFPTNSARAQALIKSPLFRQRLLQEQGGAVFDDPPARVVIPWRIAGQDGSESGGAIQAGERLPNAMAYLYPVVIYPYPRRSSEIRFKLYQPMGPESVLGSEILAKEFAIKNPKVSAAPQWPPETLPSTKVKEGLTCVLSELVVLPRDANAALLSAVPESVPLSQFDQMGDPVLLQRYGAHYERSLKGLTRCQAMFELFENGVPTPHWTMHGFRILDSTGNATSTGGSTLPSGIAMRLTSRNSGSPSAQGGWVTHSINSAAGGLEQFLLAKMEGNQITCLSTPLWPDETAWKVQIDLERSGNFSPKTTFSFDDIPFPPEPGTSAFVRETQLFGRTVKIHALGARAQNPFIRTVPPSPPRPYPLLVFEFDPQTSSRDNVSFKVVKVVEARTDTGRLLRTSAVRSDYGYRLKDNWMVDFYELRNPTPTSGMSDYARERTLTQPIKSIRITLAIPEKRTFEFLANPTWVKAASKTTPSNAPRQ